MGDMLKSSPLIVVMIVAIGGSVGCDASARRARKMAEHDYEQLSGTWRLTRAVVDGRPVPEKEMQSTILITDGDTFRFPEASGVATHPAGTLG